MNTPTRLDILVVIDNGEAVECYKSSYGYSLYITAYYGNGTRKSFLFDTGESWSTLNHNLRVSRVDCGFRKVVISHWHRDHYGGLKGLVENCKPLKIYVPTRWKICKELERLGGDIVECKGRTQIYDGIWAYGPISGSDEIVVKVLVENLGSILITGCGHAGATNILRWALESGEDLYSLIGGLHVKWKNRETTVKVARILRDRNIREYYPLHHRFKRASRLRRELKGVIRELKVGEWATFKP